MRLFIPKFLLKIINIYPFLISSIFGFLLFYLILVYLPIENFIPAYFILILCLIILCLVVVISIFYFIWIIQNRQYLKNYPILSPKDDEYIGIVVTTSNLRIWHPLFIYASGVILLIESFKLRNKQVKLLTNFDRDFNKEEFKRMVEDPNCKELYILGHGLRHALKISKDEYLYYCEFQNAPKKEKIIQLHCNHMGGKSLADFLNAKEDFKTDKTRFVGENIRYCLNKYIESQK